MLTLIAPCSPTLLALALLVGVGAAQAPDDLPRAPDGRPGLGGGLDRSGLMRLLRTPDAEQEAFLQELDQLASSVSVLVQNTLGLYRSRGYLALLQGEPEESHASLSRAFRLAREDFEGWLPREDPASDAFARMLVDTRYQVRLELCARSPLEAEELTSGLAVLRASAEGHVELTEAEVAAIGRRVDLAAASLRAVHKDLEALREPMGWPGGGDLDAEVGAWRALREVAAQERSLAIEAFWLERSRRANSMRSVLFSAHLDESAQGEFAWRGRAQDMGRGHLLDARQAWPDEEEDGAIPAYLAKLSRTERRRLTRVKAVEGLLYDPLGAELALLAAKSSRVVHGTAEALSHYDRFLALRGIRSHDDRTWDEDELDEDERDALLYIQASLLEGRVSGGGG